MSAESNLADRVRHHRERLGLTQQRLAELATYTNHALVIEAPYADFLNPKKIHHYSLSFCATVIAELYALHPDLRIVFCANRKLANEWTRHYFSAVRNLAHNPGG